jgi:hypothetical protein
MENAIELRSLGIISSTEEAAEVMARAGAAAANMGKDANQGVQAITEFLKSGSTTQLETLGLLSRSNTAFLLSQSAMSKFGGVAGSAMTMSQRLNVGMQLLMEQTNGVMRGFRDYMDVIRDFQKFTGYAAKDVNMLMVEAFSPLIDSASKLALGISVVAQQIREGDKEILFLIKSAGVATTAIVGLTAAVGTLRLSVLALGALGLKVGVLAGGFLALGATFLGVTSKADGIVNKLKVFGAVLQGTHQLVSSFFDTSENMAEGVGYIDSSLKRLLQDHGLFDFVKLLAKVSVTVVQFGKGVADGFIEAFTAVKTFVSNTMRTFLDLFSMDSSPLSRNIFDGARDIGASIGKATVAV